MSRIERQRLSFPGRDGQILAARLDRPATSPRAVALFAHCFTCGKDLSSASRLAAALANRGIAVLRFDFTGLGHSEGEFANTNFASNVEDLVAAAEFLRQGLGAPTLLVGHSLGGAAVLAAAHRLPEVRAVATIGAPADPAHVRELFSVHAEDIETKGRTDVEIGGRRFPITAQFLRDLEAHPLEEQIGSLKRALLVMHAPRDAVVGIENASRIFQAAKHPKSFVSLDDADHLLSRRRDAEYAAEVLAAWALRYAVEGDDRKASPRAEAGEVVVAESGEGPYGQHIAAGPHAMLADEPPSVGGRDIGPTPYDLLLASLGACTSMTLRMYADRKGLPLEHVEVRLRHEKVHARDCEACETETGKIDRIDREITLQGPLDEAQRTRLLEIADRCPVHRTLHTEVAVRSRLTPG